MKNQKLFKAFLALKPKEIRETVVLSPVIYPKQFEKIIGKRGKHCKSILSYLVANFKHLTFVKTPMTQAAVSDAVIMLKETPCKKLIFIGAIGGLAKRLKIGDVISTNKPSHVYSVKSIHEETRKKLVQLQRKDVIGIDFESRGFFSAARKAKLSATAYYVVTDLPLVKPFYIGTTKREKGKIMNSIIQILKVFEP